MGIKQFQMFLFLNVRNMKHVLALLPNMALKYSQSNVCLLLLYTMWCNGKDLSWRHIMDLYEEDGKPSHPLCRSLGTSTSTWHLFPKWGLTWLHRYVCQRALVILVNTFTAVLSIQCRCWARPFRRHWHWGVDMRQKKLPVFSRWWRSISTM